jgi:hypothetical protein
MLLTSDCSDARVGVQGHTHQGGRGGIAKSDAALASFHARGQTERSLQQRTVNRWAESDRLAGRAAKSTLDRDESVQSEDVSCLHRTVFILLRPHLKVRSCSSYDKTIQMPDLPRSA